MKNNTTIGYLIIVATIAGVFNLEQALSTTTYKVEAHEEVTNATLTHQQEIWKHALEWCESSGRHDAINPEDLDGTPSYGAYQFKPSTLDYFAGKYGVVTTGDVIDYEVQSAVVDQMILHGNEIEWERQFPWCIKKIGRPPTSKVVR